MDLALTCPICGKPELRLGKQIEDVEYAELVCGNYRSRVVYIGPRATELKPIVLQVNRSCLINLRQCKIAFIREDGYLPVLEIICGNHSVLIQPREFNLDNRVVLEKALSKIADLLKHDVQFADIAELSTDHEIEVKTGGVGCYG